MFDLGPMELLILAIVVLALFGYKRLPDAARAVGRSARIFKAETRGLRDDAPRDLDSRAEAEYLRAPRTATEQPAPAPQPAPPQQQPAPAPQQQPEQP